MPTSFTEHKRKMLQQRLKGLLEEHEVASGQLNATLAATTQLIIQRQLDTLEKEIQEVELELAALGRSEPPNTEPGAEEQHSPTKPKPLDEPPGNDGGKKQKSTQSNLRVWFDGLSDGAKAAVITGVFGILIAMCTLIGTLGAPVVIDPITQQYTPTPEPELSASTTPELVQKSTPGVFAPGEDFEKNCISSDVWTPYRGEEHDIDEKGCWQLNDWGFFSQDGGLALDFQASSKNVLRGISTKISPDSKIELYMRVDQMDSRYDIEPAVMFGFIPVSSDDPLQEGMFLLVKLQTSGQEFACVKLRGPNNQETHLPLRYQFGDTHKITFVVEDEHFSLFIDGNQVVDSVVLPSSNNSFWIGYTLPETSKLKASIKKLSIAEY